MTNSYKRYAREVLRPHFERLQKCYDEAFEKLRKHLAITPDMTERSKANIVRDSVVSSVKEKFSSVPGFQIVQENKNSEGLVLLLIEDTIAIRFKKLTLDKEGFTVSNNPTEQSRNLINQQLELSNGDETVQPIYVNAGYVLNKTGTNYSSLHLVCHHGEQVAWDLIIDAENVVTEEVADEFDFDQEPGIKRERIKPKKSDLDKAANDDS